MKKPGRPFYSITDTRVLVPQDRFRVGKQIHAVLVDQVGATLKDMRILDLGCSSGAITYYLAPFVSHATGVDVDESALLIAQTRYKRKNINFRKSSGTNLPFNKGSFDIVICNEVYPYVPNSKELMNEIYRVLKNGGICYFSGGNLLYPIESRYHLPFIHYLPDSVAAMVCWIFTKRPYYIGHYKTYWGLRKLAARFSITDYTSIILRQPRKYFFKKLYRVAHITRLLPLPFLQLLTSFGPTFIFVFKKIS